MSSFLFSFLTSRHWDEFMLKFKKSSWISKAFPLTPSPAGFLLFLQRKLELVVGSGVIMKPEEMAGVESSLASLFKQKSWQILPDAHTLEVDFKCNLNVVTKTLHFLCLLLWSAICRGLLLRNPSGQTCWKNPAAVHNFRSPRQITWN